VDIQIYIKKVSAVPNKDAINAHLFKEGVDGRHQGHACIQELSNGHRARVELALSRRRVNVWKQDWK